MYFLGIDQSVTSSGLAVISPGSDVPVLLRTVVPRELRGGERLAFIMREISLSVDFHTITQAAMEGYSFGSTHNAFDLGEVAGVVKCLLAQRSIPLIVVAPTQLKKFVRGKGFGDKDSVAEDIERKWGQRIDQNDQADAYGLAKVAEVYTTGVSKYREELEVVKSLKQPDVSALKPRRGPRGM